MTPTDGNIQVLTKKEKCSQEKNAPKNSGVSLTLTGTPRAFVTRGLRPPQEVRLGSVEWRTTRCCPGSWDGSTTHFRGGKVVKSKRWSELSPSKVRVISIVQFHRYTYQFFILLLLHVISIVDSSQVSAQHSFIFSSSEISASLH